jgi:hypothetical protein
MNLELPADARVLIVISPMCSTGFPEAKPLPAAFPAPRPRRLLLKGGALMVLLGGAYTLGGHSVRQAGALQARARYDAPQPPSTGRVPSGLEDVPPAFAQQLQQPPTVTPPPSAAPSGGQAKSGFGLED